jgi:hypothetical protein
VIAGGTVARWAAWSSSPTARRPPPSRRQAEEQHACVQAASTVARTANSTSVKVFGGSVIVGAGLSPELDTPGTDR